MCGVICDFSFCIVWRLVLCDGSVSVCGSFDVSLPCYIEPLICLTSTSIWFWPWLWSSVIVGMLLSRDLHPICLGSQRRRAKNPWFVGKFVHLRVHHFCRSCATLPCILAEFISCTSNSKPRGIMIKMILFLLPEMRSLLYSYCFHTIYWLWLPTYKWFKCSSSDEDMSQSLHHIVPNTTKSQTTIVAQNAKLLIEHRWIHKINKY